MDQQNGLARIDRGHEEKKIIDDAVRKNGEMYRRTLTD